MTDSGYAPYLLAITPSEAETGYKLLSYCGFDYAGQTITPSECLRDVHLHTEDVAPSNGRLILNVDFGTLNRPEGNTIAMVSITAGEKVDTAVLFEGAKWARLWWQPVGSSDWYLLPSQYWQGDGKGHSEWGISCETLDAPSYHTAFANAIHSSDVPLFNP